jgi:hypothetical protein
MRTLLSFLLILFLTFSLSSAGHYSCRTFSDFGYGHLEDVDIDIDDGSVIITYDGRRNYEEVEITEDYELLIDGERIKTDRDQRELLKEYHETVFKIHECAKAIGLRGAELGIKGAKIGMKAIGGVFKAIFTDYDFEEFEEDIEWEAEKLEDEAEELEEEAEEIEELAENLEEIHEDLVDEIPELEELGWF